MSREVIHYNLQMIIAVGFKVNNDRAVRFRKWSGQIVKDYTIQGFIPNLTRNIRSHAFIENVVTHGDYQVRGYVTACLDYVRQIARGNNCYEVMLLTRSREESALNFY